MANSINWQRDRDLKKIQKYGIDRAVDARVSLEKSSAIQWDSGGDWWHNRMLIANSWIDVIDSILSDIRNHELDHVVHVWKEKQALAILQKRNPPIIFEKWLTGFKSDLIRIRADWKEVKALLHFTLTSEDEIHRQKTILSDIYKRSLVLLYPANA